LNAGLGCGVVSVYSSVWSSFVDALQECL
jgi:hypothetical protein